MGVVARIDKYPKQSFETQSDKYSCAFSSQQQKKRKTKETITRSPIKLAPLRLPSVASRIDWMAPLRRVVWTLLNLQQSPLTGTPSSPSAAASRISLITPYSPATIEVGVHAGVQFVHNVALVRTRGIGCRAGGRSGVRGAVVAVRVNTRIGFVQDRCLVGASTARHGSVCSSGDAGCLFRGAVGGGTEACATATAGADTGVQLVHHFRIVRPAARRAGPKTGGTVSARVGSGIPRVCRVRAMKAITRRACGVR